jgi:hypothetical protein
MFMIKSISAQIHDTGYGGYPFKIVVQVAVDAKSYAKLPRHGSKRDLGPLVLSVNNALYAFNSNIPAHNPSIDSEGGTRARKGIKTMEFVYFFKDVGAAKALGYELHKGVNSMVPKYGQYINLMKQGE